MRYRVVVRLLALLALAACSDEGTPTDAPADANLCMDFTNSALAGQTSSSQDGTIFSADLTPNPMQEVGQYWSIGLRFVPGRGVFNDGLATGTYSIESDPETCGLCATVYWHVSGGHTGYHVRGTYQGDAGTVTITSFAPVSGSMQNIHMPLTFADLQAPTGCVRVVSTTFASN